MGKAGISVAALVLAASVGVAVGYLLATDEETRNQDLEKLRKSIDSMKKKVAKKGMDVEEEIYHS